jgi:hypothetical protein
MFLTFLKHISKEWPENRVGTSCHFLPSEENLLLRNLLCDVSKVSYALPKAKLGKWIMSFSNLL